ncbi:hypothetical protein [Absidia glauca]|uniref:WRKY domain-containing protein n=1 Tax=Absidia glauca TaxID=4829 RepID=A0A163MR28_ABSGL|nr:hypothetical protein [Absidia glauca]
MDFCQSEPGFISTALSTYSSNHDATCSKDHDHSPLVMVTGTEEYHEGALYHPTSNPFTSISDTELAPTPSCDLQQILFYYRSQPDLLQLILESKLQEDRRRSEEARLRAKELDWLLLQQSIHHLIYTQDQQPTLTKRRRGSSLHIDSAEDQVGLFQRMASSVPVDDTLLPQPEQKPSRKRREMQAITMMVETRDPIYVDGYFWRNNGNTIQKKTGNKSVYFKCSNSAKGCPVNKTSTYFHETGDYVIKYRGDHLPECSKICKLAWVDTDSLLDATITTTNLMDS